MRMSRLKKRSVQREMSRVTPLKRGCPRMGYLRLFRTNWTPCRRGFWNYDRNVANQGFSGSGGTGLKTRIETAGHTHCGIGKTLAQGLRGNAQTLQATAAHAASVSLCHGVLKDAR